MSFMSGFSLKFWLVNEEIQFWFIRERVSVGIILFLFVLRGVFYFLFFIFIFLLGFVSLLKWF